MKKIFLMMTFVLSGTLLFSMDDGVRSIRFPDGAYAQLSEVPVGSLVMEDRIVVLDPLTCQFTVVARQMPLSFSLEMEIRNAAMPKLLTDAPGPDVGSVPRCLLTGRSHDAFRRLEASNIVRTWQDTIKAKTDGMPLLLEDVKE